MSAATWGARKDWTPVRPPLGRVYDLPAVKGCRLPNRPSRNGVRPSRLHHTPSADRWMLARTARSSYSVGPACDSGSNLSRWSAARACRMTASTMTETETALRAAIDILRDSIECRRMPSGELLGAGNSPYPPDGSEGVPLSIPCDRMRGAPVKHDITHDVIPMSAGVAGSSPRPDGWHPA